uniref:NmrA-like domain-containing protein n=1 Tax=Oryza meridionalis TaxID=40149 RepID=A0A0E0E200_9ORYZ
MAAARKERSRVLVIGGTGYISRYIVAASAREGHLTSVLVRDPAPADPAKAAVLQGFRDSGATLVKGDLYDHESLVAAIKSADVVISAVGYAQLADQTRIISAIKEAGNVKRFFPSEYGNDVDRVHAVEPVKSVYATKARIRRVIEAEGIPYTCLLELLCWSFLAKSGTGLDQGPSNRQGVFATEEDVGTYTIKAVDDPRTLKKILYLRPPSNILSHNELVSLWEKKVGKTFERVYIPEDEVLKKTQESPAPLNVVLSINHSVWVKGDHTNFEIEPSFGVEATELYPDVKYTTVDEYLNRFL